MFFSNLVQVVSGHVTWSAAAALVLSALLWVAQTIWRYRKSALREFTPYSTFVLGALRLTIRRRVNKALAAQFSLRRYAESQLSSFPRFVDVPTASAEPYRVDIERTYVQLALRMGGTNRILDDQLISADTRSLLIVGDPGSGKSTLLRKLYRDACKEATLHPQTARLALYRELRNVSWTSKKSKQGKRAKPEKTDTEAVGIQQANAPRLVQEFRGAFINNPAIYQSEILFNTFLDGPGLLILLDGLDEVPSAEMEAAMRELMQLQKWLSDRSPNTTVVVTSRMQLYVSLPRVFLSLFHQIATIEPFTPADIFTFLRRWRPKGDGYREVHRILQSLADQPTLGEMCRNPLILAMYVAHDQRGVVGGDSATQVAAKRLPETRTKFYEVVLGELLVYRRQGQLTLGSGQEALRRQRERILGRIALKHLLNTAEPANAVSWSDAVTITGEVLKLKSDNTSAQFLRNLSKDTGLVTEERRDESLAFLHLTFCEYFAAKELQQSADDRWTDVLKTLRSLIGVGEETRLWEVCAFAAALYPEYRHDKSLADLSTLGQPLLLLRCVRESQDYESPVGMAAVSEITKTLAATTADQWSFWEASALRLVISTLSDAERIGGVTGQHAFPPLQEVLARLTTEDRTTNEKLVGQLLNVNPSEALLLAAALGLDMFEVAVRDLVSALQHSELVMHAMSEVVGGTTEGDRWISLLAEAGLRYALVARILSLEVIPLALERKLDQVQRANQWHKCGVQDMDSLYGAVLALATTRVRNWVRNDDLPRVAFLSAVQARRNVLSVVFGQLYTAFLPLATVQVGLLTSLVAIIQIKRPLAPDPSQLSVILLSGCVVGLVINTFLSVVSVRARAGESVRFPELARVPKSPNLALRTVLNIVERERISIGNRSVLMRVGGRRVALVPIEMREDTRAAFSTQLFDELRRRRKPIRLLPGAPTREISIGMWQWEAYARPASAWDIERWDEWRQAALAIDQFDALSILAL